MRFKGNARSHQAPVRDRCSVGRFAGMLLLAAALLFAAWWPGRAVAACVGDCGGEGDDVAVTDLIVMVNVALGTAAVSTCPAGDADSGGTIDITEIITAVNNALTGCSPAPTPTATQTPGGSTSYVGDYHGTAGGYAVRFHVAANGSASGFLDFLSGALSVAGNGGGGDVVASYPASGTANLDTGAYQLSGSFFGNSFDFAGQLPAGPDATGTLTVTVFGTASEGTLSAGAAPPTPTPQPDCNTASLQITFSNLSGDFNGVSSGFVVERMLVAVEQMAPDFIAGLHEVYNSLFNGVECTQAGQQRLRNIQISLYEVPGGLAAGQQIPLSQGSESGVGGIVFYGEEGAGGDRAWSSSSGTVFIDAVNGSVVTLRVVGAAMTVPAGVAAGSFTLDVSGQVNNFSRQ